MNSTNFESDCDQHAKDLGRKDQEHEQWLNKCLELPPLACLKALMEYMSFADAKHVMMNAEVMERKVLAEIMSAQKLEEVMDFLGEKVEELKKLIPAKEECETCEGKGKLWSSCCGDELDEGDYEGDDTLCPTCQEHCSIDDFEICEECNGTGFKKEEGLEQILNDQDYKKIINS